jgi:hypothetical protein
LSGGGGGARRSGLTGALAEPPNARGGMGDERAR